MDDFFNIQNYLEAYWQKYPQEKQTDPTLQEIKDYIAEGGKYFIKDNIFILYEVYPRLAHIVFYWCDMKDVPRKIVSDTLRTHKQFINSFDIEVYSRDIKKLFDREYLVRYNEKLNLWRWV